MREAPSRTPLPTHERTLRSTGRRRHRERRPDCASADTGAVQKNCVATGSDLARAALEQPASKWTRAALKTVFFSLHVFHREQRLSKASEMIHLKLPREARKTYGGPQCKSKSH